MQSFETVGQTDINPYRVSELNKQNINAKLFDLDEGTDRSKKRKTSLLKINMHDIML